MPGRPRHGTLSDEATLRAYERGVDVERLAHSENCTGGAILARVSRARAARRQIEGAREEALDRINGFPPIRETRQLLRPPGEPDVFAPLRAAIARLADLERQHA